MTGPKATPPAPTPTPQSATPAVTTSGQPATGAADGGHFVLTRRRARQLVARAQGLGLKVPRVLHERAAPLPVEQQDGDTRPVADAGTDQLSVAATQRELQRAAADAAQDQDAQHEQHEQHEQAQEQADDDETRAGSRETPQRTSSHAHAKRASKRAR